MERKNNIENILKVKDPLTNPELIFLHKKKDEIVMA